MADAVKPPKWTEEDAMASVRQTVEITRRLSANHVARNEDIIKPKPEVRRKNADGQSVH